MCLFTSRFGLKANVFSPDQRCVSSHLKVWTRSRFTHFKPCSCLSHVCPPFWGFSSFQVWSSWHPRTTITATHYPAFHTLDVVLEWWLVGQITPGQHSLLGKKRMKGGVTKKEEKEQRSEELCLLFGLWCNLSQVKVGGEPGGLWEWMAITMATDAQVYVACGWCHHHCWIWRWSAMVKLAPDINTHTTAHPERVQEESQTRL